MSLPREAVHIRQAKIADQAALLALDPFGEVERLTKALEKAKLPAEAGIIGSSWDVTSGEVPDLAAVHVAFEKQRRLPGNSCTDCGAGPLLYSARAMAGPVLCHPCAHRRLADAWGGLPIWAAVRADGSRVFNFLPKIGLLEGEQVVEGRFLPVDARAVEVFRLMAAHGGAWRGAA